MSTSPEQNKQIVREIFDKVINGGDVELAARYYKPDYIQHNPHVEQGLQGLQALLRRMHSMDPPLRAEIVLMNAEDDMVWLLLRWSGGPSGAGVPRIGTSAEIFRVEDGMMAEHWDVVQMETPKR